MLHLALLHTIDESTAIFFGRSFFSKSAFEFEYSRAD